VLQAPVKPFITQLSKLVQANVPATSSAAVDKAAKIAKLFRLFKTQITPSRYYRIVISSDEKTDYMLLNLVIHLDTTYYNIISIKINICFNVKYLVCGEYSSLQRLEKTAATVQMEKMPKMREAALWT